MAKFKPVIRTSQKNGDGKCNVKIRITHNRSVRYLSTTFYVLEEYFSVKKGEVLPGGGYTVSTASNANNRLLMLMGQYASRLDNYHRDLSKMPIQMVMKILREERDYYDFMAALSDEIKLLGDAGKEKYQGVFVDTRNTIKRFAGESPLPFETITAEWLRGLENDILKRGNKINTVSLHMRNIRTIYNRAITKKIADLSGYPFREYRIPKQRTIKRNISSEEIHNIITFTSPDKNLLWARDMFMLSFYLIGINMKDMFYLRGMDFDRATGRIDYVRNKGKQYYSVKVYPEAMDILERYAGCALSGADTKKLKNQLLLDVMEGRYTHHSIATRMVNDRIKRIAIMVGISQPITTYYARHSWATIAHRLGVSRDIIRYALGHGINSTVTDIYIDFDQGQVDQANRMVIDQVNRSPS